MRLIDLLLTVCSLMTLVDAKLGQSKEFGLAKVRLMQASGEPNASIANLTTTHDSKTSSSTVPSTVISSHSTSTIPQTLSPTPFVSTHQHSNSTTITELTTLIVSSTSAVNVSTTTSPTTSSTTPGSTQSKTPETTSIIVTTTVSVPVSSTDSSSVTSTNTPSIATTQSETNSTQISTTESSTTLVPTTTTSLIPSTPPDTTITESNSTTTEFSTTEEIPETTTQSETEIDADAFETVNGKARCGSFNFVQLLVLLSIILFFFSASTCGTVSKMGSISTDVSSSTYAPESIQPTTVDFAAQAAEITTGVCWRKSDIEHLNRDEWIGTYGFMIAFILIIIAITAVIVATSLEEKYRWEYQSVKRRQIRPRLTLEYLRALQQAARNG